MFPLPFVLLQGRLLGALEARRERQQSLALDSARYHEDTGLEGMNVAPDILRHNLGPFTVVPAVAQKRCHNLEGTRTE